MIEKVQTPTSWVSPLVSVEKPNGDVRICLDMRRANEAIVREKHPVPTVEETLQQLSGAKYFAKLDMNMAFHQIELHPDSRDITTFAGPDGLYRYKRLIFGVNMATEKFQQIITQVLAGLPGVHNLHDDIIIAGTTLEQLHERVEMTAMLKLSWVRYTDSAKYCACSSLLLCRFPFPVVVPLRLIKVLHHQESSTIKRVIVSSCHHCIQ